jgi:hypothetical protein
MTLRGKARNRYVPTHLDFCQNEQPALGGKLKQVELRVHNAPSKIQCRRLAADLNCLLCQSKFTFLLCVSFGFWQEVAAAAASASPLVVPSLNQRRHGEEEEPAPEDPRGGAAGRRRRAGTPAAAGRGSPPPPPPRDGPQWRLHPQDDHGRRHLPDPRRPAAASLRPGQGGQSSCQGGLSWLGRRPREPGLRPLQIKGAETGFLLFIS